jgi:hypothetical protein
MPVKPLPIDIKNERIQCIAAINARVIAFWAIIRFTVKITLRVPAFHLLNAFCHPGAVSFLVKQTNGLVLQLVNDICWYTSPFSQPIQNKEAFGSLPIRVTLTERPPSACSIPMLLDINTEIFKHLSLPPYLIKPCAPFLPFEDNFGW